MNIKDGEEMQDRGHGMVKFDIEVHLTEVGEGVDFLVHYNEDVYEHEMIENLIAHYKNLLQSLLDQPKESVNKAVFLFEEERRKQLEAFNDTKTDYPREKSIADLFTAQAKETPERVAVVFGEDTLTYQELEDRSNQLARFLRSQGVAREHMVPICVERSVQMIVGILGIMYTSGSTGKPKGVMVEHKNVIRLVKDANFFKFSKEDVLLSTGSFSFDATTFEYWGPLLNGAELVLCPKEVLLDSNELEKEIARHAVTVMWFTAGWFNQLVDANIQTFRRLKTVLAGGDRLSPVHVSKLLTKYKDLEIINGYGPTENTTFSLTYNIDEVTGDIPVGYPISNSTAYILDDYQGIQPVGVVGEICVGGDGLSRGYLNQPDLTNERFVPNPFDESGRLYKTGDLGRYGADGKIEFVGRKDDQVKIRGYRIELGEIGSVLDEIMYIEQSEVIVFEDSNGIKQLVAYVVSKEELDYAAIQQMVAERLPEYMVPKVYVTLDEMPLTPNGKVDRRALPEPDENSYNKQEYVAPTNDTETKIVEIWQEVLNIDQSISY